MSANQRIQWLHKKISDRCYPNAFHLSEKFRISHRQAQRDVEYLRRDMGAPIAYSSLEKGYYYKEPFVLPYMLESENDVDFNDAISGMREFENTSAESSVIAAPFVNIFVQVRTELRSECGHKSNKICINLFFFSDCSHSQKDKSGERED